MNYGIFQLIKSNIQCRIARVRNYNNILIHSILTFSELDSGIKSL